MAITSPKRRSRLELKQFIGVDFANVETDVDMRRSPYAKNMIADQAGRPEKRQGYEKLLTLEGKINGIHVFQEEPIYHVGTKLYDETGQLVYSGMADARSTSFRMGEHLYLLDGSHYIAFDGENAVSVEGFIPTTVIGAKPAGGGTAFEAINLLTPKRKNSFTADGVAKEFYLDSQNVDSIDAVNLGISYTVDLEAGKVIFEEAPPKDNGVDSVVITFSKAVAGNREKIEKCTIAETYGLGNDTRVFLSGNPDECNLDWQSGLYDPTYFPDTGYTRIGSKKSAIMGYMKQYGKMLILKEQITGEIGLYLRTAELDDQGNAYFPVKEGMAGIGAISKHAFANFGGDPIFLSKNGVFGMDTNAITNQSSVQLRSWYVNRALTEEEGLDQAVAAVWGRFYVLSINGHCYVANAEATNKNPTGSFGYEWYYWENVPIRVMEVIKGRLYFGTEDGRILRFYNEKTMKTFSDDGEAIDAIWTSPLLDGGDFMREKSISKKGTGILAKPYTRSSGEIYFTTDKAVSTLARKYTLDIFNFDDIDFNRFTFNTRDNPKVIIAPKKFRKVLQFQMAVRNHTVNEGFGILGMMISFTMGNLTRRKT